MKKIRLYDIEGNMLEDFDSVFDLATELEEPRPNIDKVLKGNNITFNSFQAREINGQTPKKLPSAFDIYNSGKAKVPVAKYWKNRLISVYNSQSEAAMKNNTAQDLISHSVLNGTEVNGFVFKKII